MNEIKCQISRHFNENSSYNSASWELIFWLRKKAPYQAEIMMIYASPKAKSEN